MKATTQKTKILLHAMADYYKSHKSATGQIMFPTSDSATLPFNYNYSDIVHRLNIFYCLEYVR
jgi:hypothetical protein